MDVGDLQQIISLPNPLVVVPKTRVFAFNLNHEPVDLRVIVNAKDKAHAVVADV